MIAAPSANWSRAVALAIEGVALVFAVATARERQEIRRRRAVGLGVAMIALILLVASGAAPSQLTDAASAVTTAAIPVVIVGGLLRLLRERGVTVQAVAGALAIYLAVGLVFAAIIGFITHVDSTPYFAQHTSGTEGDRVYFSFTILTTTGFGDFSAATPAGHALAVIEELTGAALPRYGDRAADRQLRQQTQDDMTADTGRPAAGSWPRNIEGGEGWTTLRVVRW